jgi:hypothetical protein
MPTNPVQIGKTGLYEYQITSNVRYFSLKATATSNSAAVSVCSIHVKVNRS